MEASVPTVSAAEFSRLTGISRERLRTWERRHGFPHPIRSGSGARRYVVSDIAPSIGVRRAVDAGVPVAEAITRAQAEVAATPGAADLAAGLDESPLPTVLVAGPRPMLVVYANRVARDALDAPPVGAEIGGGAGERLAAVFAAAGPVRLERPSWRETGVTVPCIAAPLTPARGAPLVAVYDLESPEAQAERTEVATLADEVERVRDRLAERDAALDVCMSVSEALRSQTGVDAILASTELLMRRLRVIDAALAPYMSGQIVLGRSTRGLLGPEMLTVAAHPELSHAVRTGEITTLPPRAAAGLGLPEDLSALLVPARCAGEPLGVLLLAFEDAPVLGSGMARALTIVGTELGLALMQERLLTGEPGAGR